MHQPADIRNLSARRSAGASVVELHTADQNIPTRTISLERERSSQVA